MPLVSTFPSPRPPSGLAGPPGELVWLGLPLVARQERAALENKLGWAPEQGDGPVPAEGMVLVREDAVVTAQAIAALVERGQQVGRDLSWRTGGRAGAFHAEIAFGRDEPLLVWLAPGGEGTVAQRLKAAKPEVFDPEERLIQVPVSRAQFGVDAVELPLTERLVLPAGHWVQLLWCNLLGLAPFLWRELAGRNILQVAWRLGAAALRARSVDPVRVGARLGRTGRGVRVHPSAVVEGCWLGDDVVIGAGAVVRGSILADGAVVEDQALTEFAVLASGARVQRQAMVKFSVLCERAAAAGTMQLGVLDRGAALKYGGVLMDMALGQQVRVRVDGELRPAPLGLVGVCVGEETQVGTGVQVAAGRALPGGLHVVAGGDQVVRIIPADLSGRVVVRDGRLEQW